MAIELVFETHSTTEDNEAGRATGWLPGQLSERGRARARQLGQRRSSDRITAVFSSDPRCPDKGRSGLLVDIDGREDVTGGSSVHMPVSQIINDPSRLRNDVARRRPGHRLCSCCRVSPVMDTFGAGRWYGGFLCPDMLSADRRVQAVLESAEAAFRISAARLRACGQLHRACRVERFAAWARFDLDEPLAARQLYLAAERLRHIRRLEPLAERALDTVLSLARADRGNVQLADPASGALRIIAQHGFDAEFLDHFAIVDDGGSACGRTARRGAQTVINDVIADPGFEPHRRIAAASGFRAVQSTPLVDGAGRLVGVISTHYPRPYAPSVRDMRIIRRYADLLGGVLASRHQETPVG